MCSIHFPMITGWCVGNWIQIKMPWDYEKNRHTQTKISLEKRNVKVVQFFRWEAGIDTSCASF